MVYKGSLHSIVFYIYLVFISQMQDGCKVYMDSYMTSNGSRFMVTWTILKNHLLEIGLTHKTMRPWHSEPSQLLIYFILLCMRTYIEIAFGWGPGYIWLHTTLEDLWPHYMILEASWDGLWTLSFRLSQFDGGGSWLVCEVALLVENSIYSH